MSSGASFLSSLEKRYRKILRVHSTWFIDVLLWPCGDTRCHRTCIHIKFYIGPCNGLSPVWCQATTWTSADLLWIEPEEQTSLKLWIKQNYFQSGKMSSANCWPFCSGHYMLRGRVVYIIVNYCGYEVGVGRCNRADTWRTNVIIRSKTLWCPFDIIIRLLLHHVFARNTEYPHETGVKLKSHKNSHVCNVFLSWPIVL